MASTLDSIVGSVIQNGDLVTSANSASIVKPSNYSAVTEQEKFNSEILSDSYVDKLNSIIKESDILTQDCMRLEGLLFKLNGIALRTSSLRKTGMSENDIHFTRDNIRDVLTEYEEIKARRSRFTLDDDNEFEKEMSAIEHQLENSKVPDDFINTTNGLFNRITKSISNLWTRLKNFDKEFSNFFKSFKNYDTTELNRLLDDVKSGRKTATSVVVNDEKLMEKLAMYFADSNNNSNDVIDVERLITLLETPYRAVVERKAFEKVTNSFTGNMYALGEGKSVELPEDKDTIKEYQEVKDKKLLSFIPKGTKLAFIDNYATSYVCSIALVQPKENVNKITLRTDFYNVDKSFYKGKSIQSLDEASVIRLLEWGTGYYSKFLAMTAALDKFDVSVLLACMKAIILDVSVKIMVGSATAIGGATAFGVGTILASYGFMAAEAVITAGAPIVVVGTALALGYYMVFLGYRAINAALTMKTIFKRLKVSGIDILQLVTELAKVSVR